MDINKLIYLANYLDKIGLAKEAEFIDNLIISAQDGSIDDEEIVVDNEQESSD
tara:strand:- start:1119 stop:1277 length:159 start_codon:yes stop_codon:yes gene_type:complete